MELADVLYVSPPQVARRFGVKSDKVIAWIRSGELRAINCATRPGGRPRWKISPADLAAFEAGRAAQPPVPRRQRRKDPAVIEFF